MKKILIILILFLSINSAFSIDNPIIKKSLNNLLSEGYKIFKMSTHDHYVFFTLKKIKAELVDKSVQYDSVKGLRTSESIVICKVNTNVTISDDNTSIIGINDQELQICWKP